MTAALHDNAAPAPQAPAAGVQPGPQAPAAGAQPAPPWREKASADGGDPLMSAATRLLTVPMRQMYAVLWRLGVIEVRV